MACAFGTIAGCIHGTAVGQSWHTIKLDHPGTTWAYVLGGSGRSVGGWATVGGIAHPVVWDLPSGAYTDLYPSPNGGVVNAVFEGWQGGDVGAGGHAHASIWHGTPESRIDLHPTSDPYISEVLAMDATSQSGRTRTAIADTTFRAALWHGTAASYTDLHPAGAKLSSATAVAGDQQGGWFTLSTGGYHAAMWHGTAASLIDLSPVGTTESQIFGMSGDQQVGWAYPTGSGFFHAALWRGTKESYIDLAPPLTGFSRLNATCGSAQAGDANNVAAVWFGTRDSYQNLQPYLPPGYGQSTATSVSLVDGTYYIGGYANNNATGRDEPFVWIGVPAPGTAAAFTAAAALWARRMRR